MAMKNVKELAQLVRRSAKKTAVSSLKERNDALEAMAVGLESNRKRIEEANKTDLELVKDDAEITNAVRARLGFHGGKFAGAVSGVRDLKRLGDPIGAVEIHRELADGLILKRKKVPLGVLGIIFEARPDAAVQIASLAVKSGNGVILKCGREAVNTCSAIVETLHSSLSSTVVPPSTIELLTSREETREMLTCSSEIDLIIPRGSNQFVQYVQKNTTIPVLGHADGICHIYIDAEADLNKALPICIDSKTQYPSACNSVETILIHKSLSGSFLPTLLKELEAHGVKVNGCEKVREGFPGLGVVSEWAVEYCDKEVSIKIVENQEEAMDHIVKYGSKHTDCIVTENRTNAEVFQSLIPSAGVFHNCSTRFADGFRYGFGAEVGVSTSNMPPRGPVGLEGITTHKYYLSSASVHTVGPFASGEMSFTHKDLPL
eukprot:TRINITY_DN16152_c0_g5_i1.p1 TRINITY_DN16152_c0_g5~~TRINITY_DN16152_c0_g5_i1.p1  ORF type:complete len:449 (+),score=141.35 TRINITY_DN16152_c0_g5_i1:54-1349(+)